MHEDPPATARTTAPRTRARTAPAPPAVPFAVLAPVAPGPVSPSASAPPPGPPPGHSATTIERGSFCLARCTCGWSGPARRSRDLARTDAAKHVSTP
ncbi:MULTISPECIES: hypothetical protein [Streptomyces]|uniref:hypothetical protein n=1 Tax=Streptomyces TaxID=1883 RepID=UPI0004CA20C8|nr:MULTISPECIES: hypothetical protein [Streptomyces]MYR09311.1 hypothetical protein [Streptomyces sp. SID724]MYR51569.1 hypothetical protein [Streptomyces sp. SID4928]MYT81693.1 hypothetical protein [Streptomyces sp. SID8364]